MSHPTNQMPAGSELREISEVLPYAIVLGGSDRWLDAMVASDADELPDSDDLSWYHGPGELAPARPAGLDEELRDHCLREPILPLMPVLFFRGTRPDQCRFCNAYPFFAQPSMINFLTSDGVSSGLSDSSRLIVASTHRCGSGSSLPD